MLFQLELRNIVPAENRRNANLAYKMVIIVKKYARIGVMKGKVLHMVKKEGIFSI